uniref:Uncharacterized protein n=1 Tax=Guillardia theta TaxID=55529 RepID=A0A6U5VSR9_GUITH|mmetsp:Transcript_10903/g.36802  ORF Transcript_10903/g.36802 Transcript_10903/m.36802 type:complete len:151 (+) Transcript_10903:297-749(+)
MRLEKQQGMGHENPQMRRGGMDPPYDDPHMFNNFPPGYPQMPMLANPFGMPGQLASAGLQHMPNAGDPQLGSPARRMNAHPLDPDMQQFMEDDWWRAPGEAQSQEHAAGKPQSFLPAIDGGGRGNKGRTPPPGKKDASRAQQNRNPARKK